MICKFIQNRHVYHIRMPFNNRDYFIVEYIGQNQYQKNDILAT